MNILCAVLAIIAYLGVAIGLFYGTTYLAIKHFSYDDARLFQPGFFLLSAFWPVGIPLLLSAAVAAAFSGWILESASRHYSSRHP